MPATDAQTRMTLLDKIRSRHAEAWREFSLVYQSLLMAYIKRLSDAYNLRLKDEEVEDARQEVFIKLWKVLPEFRLDRDGRGRFRSWLWTITRNVTIDWVRSNRSPHLAGALEGDVVDKQLEPDAQLIADHSQAVFARILERVKVEMQSARQWDCFERHFLQKRPSNDVAAELELSASAVYTYTSRVRARILELAEEYDLGE